MHNENYIQSVKESEEKDCHLSASTAVGGAIEAVRIVCDEEEIENRVDSSFAIIRPPGHHA